MKKWMQTFILIGGLSTTASATEHSREVLSKLSKRFFPAISEEVTECATQWPNYFRDGDRELILDGYFAHAIGIMNGNGQAQDLKKQFEAMARYWRTDTTAILKVFGCARDVTGEVQGGTNLFVEANRLFLAFSDDLKSAFFANIDAFREDFGGRGVKDKNAKIENITRHIQDLESLAGCANHYFEDELRNQHNSIYNFILSQHGEKRELVLAFSIASAKSSLEIVKFFDPPTKKEIAGIVVNEIGHRIGDAIGGFFGGKRP